MFLFMKATRRAVGYEGGPKSNWALNLAHELEVVE